MLFETIEKIRVVAFQENHEGKLDWDVLFTAILTWLKLKFDEVTSAPWFSRTQVEARGVAVALIL